MVCHRRALCLTVCAIGLVTVRFAWFFSGVLRRYEFVMDILLAGLSTLCVCVRASSLFLWSFTEVDYAA